jgi:hypothetical protein
MFAAAAGSAIDARRRGPMFGRQIDILVSGSPQKTEISQAAAKTRVIRRGPTGQDVGNVVSW